LPNIFQGYDEPTSVRAPEGRIVAGFDVGRTRDRSELAVFEEEEIEGCFTARMLRSFEGTPFAPQEAELRRLLGTLPVARLSIDRSGIGINSPRTCRATSRRSSARTSPTRPRSAGRRTSRSSSRRYVTMPRDRELVGQIDAIKRRGSRTAGAATARTRWAAAPPGCTGPRRDLLDQVPFEKGDLLLGPS
jgi:hypothetical protein